MSGILYLCATPIGNLEDITLRVLRILKEVDVIAAEDTRTSSVLLKKYGISTPMISYHKFNEKERSEDIISRLEEGKNVALITDAGTPGISDPGEVLVRECRKCGITVTSLPGPSALITALSLSGKNTGRFVFEGFLPGNKKDRNAVLEEIKDETRTVIIYEAPHRIKKTLEILKEALGNREITLCRELTKKFETIEETDIETALKNMEENAPRGEYVVVIKGKDPEEVRAENAGKWEGVPIEEHMAFYEDRGMDRKSAMKAVAADLMITKRDVYKMLAEKDDL